MLRGKRTLILWTLGDRLYPAQIFQTPIDLLKSFSNSSNFHRKFQTLSENQRKKVSLDKLRNIPTSHIFSPKFANLLNISQNSSNSWVFGLKKRPASVQLFRKQSHFPVEPESAQNEAKISSCSHFSTITCSSVRIC